MTFGHNPSILPAFQNKIAHYRILRKLGQGGMSIVYEGLDEKLKRPVALKVLHPHLAEAPEYRLRFFREAEAVARLTHPNIVQIYDVASADASAQPLYIVTERLLGQTLKDFVTRHSFFELPELAAMLIWVIAQALEHAHQKGIIHRDIKPENIMICHDGTIKLMDFGIASIGNEENLTQSGTLLGTFNHVAPEIIQGKKATIASDLFSLATIFYWLLTNELPFAGDSPHALLKAIVDSPCKKIQSLSPYAEDELAEIVERGMNKDPKLRFSSASSMSDAIENALIHFGVTVDSKLIQMVLKDPEQQAAAAKTRIITSIEKQLEIYREKKDDLHEMMLLCRLEAAASCTYPTHPLTPEKHKDQPLPSTLEKSSDIRIDQNRRPKKGFLPWIIITAALVGLITALGWWLNKPNVQKSALVVVPTSPVSIDAKIDDISKEIAPETPNIEPTKMPENSPKKEMPRIALQDVEIVVRPFASIFLDDRLIAKDKKSVHIRVSPGVHRLTFTHQFAATVEKVIRVLESSKKIEINVSLIKSKPAFLKVSANIDADVAIDKSFKGTSKKSLSHPIVVPIADRTHSATKEVIVSQEGFKPFVATVEFIAGQTKELLVNLIHIID